MGLIITIIVSLVIGAAAMYIFKPLVDSGLAKLFGKNS